MNCVFDFPVGPMTTPEIDWMVPVGWAEMGEAMAGAYGRNKLFLRLERIQDQNLSKAVLTFATDEVNEHGRVGVYMSRAALEELSVAIRAVLKAMPVEGE